MKQQGNSFPLMANSTTKDLNNREAKEIANFEFQKIIVGMTKELKEEAQKLMYELKDDMNKPLKELKENSNR
jgi:hypothetical protein